jgi:hypothetical protein
MRSGGQGHHHEHPLRKLSLRRFQRSLATTQRRVCVLLTERPSSDSRCQPVPVLVGAVPAEFLRTFCEDRYRCFWCNERNHRGSTSLTLPSRGCVIRTFLLFNSSKKRSEHEEVTSVQGLGRMPIFQKAGARKITRHTNQGIAATRCNAHARCSTRHGFGGGATATKCRVTIFVRPLAAKTTPIRRSAPPDPGSWRTEKDVHINWTNHQQVRQSSCSEPVPPMPVQWR